MSRIGKKPINVPVGVTVTDNNGVVTVKGPKGELVQTINPDLNLIIDSGEISLERPSDSKEHKSQHGLYRSLLNNMIEGVVKGYKIDLELVGVGFKAVLSNGVLELNLGYSHPIFFALPKEVKAEAITQKGKNPIVSLESIDKQLVGQVSAKIRAMRKVEPYKGKGVRFVGEQVRRKAGKTGAK
jgi:large subunit ribosomal protein L6